MVNYAIRINQCPTDFYLKFLFIFFGGGGGGGILDILNQIFSKPSSFSSNGCFQVKLPYHVIAKLSAQANPRLDLPFKDCKIIMGTLINRYGKYIFQCSHPHTITVTHTSFAFPFSGLEFIWNLGYVTFTISKCPFALQIS